MTDARPTVALTPEATQFISSVIQLRPRLATFDCDGTLWAGDAGEQFLYWELEHGLLPTDVAQWIRARYADYKAGKVSEEAICGEMVTIHEGLLVADLEHAGAEFFAERFASAIFPEMRELVRQLREAGCEVWAVSSTNEWVVRAGTRYFGIADEHVLAASVYCNGGRASGVLQRVPTDADKAVAIKACIRREVDVAFGNSGHDVAMLKLARHAFAIDPTPELATVAREQGWTMYRPMGTAT